MQLQMPVSFLLRFVILASCPWPDQVVSGQLQDLMEMQNKQWVNVWRPPNREMHTHPLRAKNHPEWGHDGLKSGTWLLASGLNYPGMGLHGTENVSAYVQQFVLWSHFDL